MDNNNFEKIWEKPVASKKCPYTIYDCKKIIPRLRRLANKENITAMNKAYAVALALCYAENCETAKRYNIGIPMIYPDNHIERSLNAIMTFAGQTVSQQEASDNISVDEFKNAVNDIIFSHIYLFKILYASQKSFEDVLDDIVEFNVNDEETIDDVILTNAENKLNKWLNENHDTDDYRTSHLLIMAAECLVLINKIRARLFYEREQAQRKDGYDGEYFRIRLKPDFIKRDSLSETARKWRQIKALRV